MKKVFTFTFMLLFAVIPSLASADGDNHSVSVDEVVEEIMQTQNVSDPNSIDCEAVSDEEFERLGEAVMSVMHPNTKQHELMDQMMGGEGSESLQATHSNMGQNYLNCGSGGGFGMMGGGMMGGSSLKTNLNRNSSANNTDDLGGYSMMGIPFMGAGSGAGVGWISMILFWALVIFGIISIIKLLAGKNTNQDKTPDAIDIIKNRYAKGEITKEEFEKMKKDIS